MFKKTVIAAALAATTGVAMADVSVSGRVEQGFVDEDVDAGVGYTGFTDNQLNFKATEDLGNGMSAFAQISYKQAGRLDEKLGLTGGFGTVVMGRMESLTEGQVSSTMSTMGTNEGEISHGAARDDHALAYVSPTVSGFHAAIAGFATADTSDNFDSIDLLVAYDNGPFSVKLARTTTDSAAYDVAAVTAVGGLYQIGDTNATTTTAGSNPVIVDPVTEVAAETGNEYDHTSLALAYTMGDLKLSALLSKQEGGDVDNVDADDLTLRLDYTMGANKLTLQHASDESQTANTAEVDTTVVELSHAFSKRTAVYIGMSDSDNAAKENTYVGMQHTF